ncbi:hypothetical protein SNOG_10074 [Parastagonospora nodorum SN15]|uniref:Uncharacterized protein n=1 Tax=Phaeosphaeria nodorum (strain SN15 / ATCC MYA-4574 / FGSC 10173) TaxID=321614 RepID=Q0UDU0_PHANO|nr:hypothetical protein SNOG_10074 [Parastagonospora nodorum SN15]EAT82409.1 hypothetical protein SNOG_10074 [Parastagonospora nodorum SN15]
MAATASRKAITSPPSSASSPATVSPSPFLLSNVRQRIEVGNVVDFKIPSLRHYPDALQHLDSRLDFTGKLVRIYDAMIGLRQYGVVD